MLAKRIIPCLDIREGQTVKGINFVGLRNVGDPVELGAKYAAEGADELVYLDISATEEGRQTFTELVARIAERIDIPFTVGGGIASVADAGRLLDAGADKVTVNSAAVRDPALIDAIASKYGSQFVVAAIDAKKIDGVWRIHILNYVPQWHADFETGWANTRYNYVPFLSTPYPEDPTGPDEIKPDVCLWPTHKVVPFHNAHPVTGQPIVPERWQGDIDRENAAK